MAMVFTLTQLYQVPAKRADVDLFAVRQSASSWGRNSGKILTLRGKERPAFFELSSCRPGEGKGYETGGVP
jgi:hypothetical protein